MPVPSSSSNSYDATSPATITDTALGPETETGDSPIVEAYDCANVCGKATVLGLDLTLAKRFAVGSGHILNDLSASLWFSYLLFYFEKVVGLSSNYAAYLMLVGQVADAIVTPLIGYDIDHTTHFVFFGRSYGRCKSWHLFGVILVAITLPFIFAPCIGCDGAGDWAKFIYYAPFITIDSIGWCCAQISHLALLPKMNPDELVRTELLSIRYGFAVVSNVTVFILAWKYFGFQNEGLIDSSYASSFRNVAFISVGIGLIFSILFHVFVHEHSDAFVKKCMALCTKSEESSTSDPDFIRSTEKTSLLRNKNANFNASLSGVSTTGAVGAGLGESCNNYYTGSREGTILAGGVKYSLSTRFLSLGREHMQFTDWLKLTQFYAVSLVYMMTRLSVNVTQVYLPLYLQNSLKLAAKTVATVPLTMYIFGFIIAIFMRTINRLVGRQFSYILGAALVVSGSVCVLTLDMEGGQTNMSKYGIYGVAALLGSGASILMVTSLSITADLIGNNVESGAFVYGAMSFTDKLSCGLAIVLINSMVPCQKHRNNMCSDDPQGDFYKRVLAYSSGGCAAGGVVGVILVTFIIFLARMSQAQPRRQLQSPSN